MGRGGDPGVPGVCQGNSAGDPGGVKRWHQRGIIAHDSAGQGAAPMTRQAREAGLDLRLQSFRMRAGHTILRVSQSLKS
jgi:hypothetical protein